VSDVAAKCLPDVELLRELFDYDPDTGILTHRPRDRSRFSRDQDWRRWNKRYSGTAAGNNCPSGYRTVRLVGTLFKAHRLAYKMHYGIDPPPVLDHVNGDGRDNRIANIRVATNAQNRQNSRKSGSNTSGYKGVSWHKVDKVYVANIRINRRQCYLGSYRTAEEARDAYVIAGKRHFGEFFRAD
jgi:hypothetical protein